MRTGTSPVLRAASPEPEPPGAFRPIQPLKTYPIAPSHSPPCSPPLSPVLPPIPPPHCTPTSLGDRFVPVRTPATQTIILSLEEYFLHHCPDKLTEVYDPQQFALQLLQRGPKVEVAVWMPQDIEIRVEGQHCVVKEVIECPYYVDVDVFEEEEILRVVEEVHEELVEKPVERIVEKEIEVEEVEFRFVPYDRVVEVVQERVREQPVTRPVELVKEKLVVCTEDVPVCLTRERAEPIPTDHFVNMVVDRIETRVVEVPYERVVTKYVEVPFETIIEERREKLIEKIIEVEQTEVSENRIERRIPIEVIIEKPVYKPVEIITERLVTLSPKEVINEFEFDPPPAQSSPSFSSSTHSRQHYYSTPTSVQTMQPVDRRLDYGGSVKTKSHTRTSSAPVDSLWQGVNAYDSQQVVYSDCPRRYPATSQPVAKSAPKRSAAVYPPPPSAAVTYVPTYPPPSSTYTKSAFKSTVKPSSTAPSAPRSRNHSQSSTVSSTGRRKAPLVV